MDQIQRRRHRRHEVRNLRGSLLFRLDIKILNLSIAGLAVESTQQLKQGRIYSFRLGEGDASINLDATVCWCRLTGTRRGASGEGEAVYQAGLSFEGTLTSKANRLVDIMKDHVVLALQKRVIGRFKAKAGSPAELAARVEFEVTKLSLSGMLLKARVAPELHNVFSVELTIAGEPFDALGRVAFVRRTGGTDAEPEAEIGLEFIGLDERRLDVLRRFVGTELD